MLSLFFAVAERDLQLAWRRRSDIVNTMVFFVLIVSLFPLGIGADKALLQTIAPGIIWVAALLSSMLAAPRLFAGDYADGTLEQMLLSAEPLVVIVSAKILAHFLISGLPLVCISPLLALQFDLPLDAIAILVLSLLLGTPALSLTGAIGAALTLGVRGSAVLLSLLVLPLTIPVLIFGSGVFLAHSAGLDTTAYWYVLAGMLAALAVLAPVASSYSLRIMLD
ncbi:heme exporter protein CcmB [Undibacterium pigrum]|uniref:Heme exporter protein B n=1 Tax=Undibacterium pigrum TaxID=401470 RepID=A0A318J856_9BURK|nr:heme exporter protein CcmB [Undibacterium pigrum]PXX44071.1 heme exporter protein B [Undibacterium pigrum]